MKKTYSLVNQTKSEEQESVQSICIKVPLFLSGLLSLSLSSSLLLSVHSIFLSVLSSLSLFSLPSPSSLSSLCVLDTVSLLSRLSSGVYVGVDVVDVTNTTTLVFLLCLVKTARHNYVFHSIFVYCHYFGLACSAEIGPVF